MVKQRSQSRFPWYAPAPKIRTAQAILVWVDLLGFSHLLQQVGHRDPTARRQFGLLSRLVKRVATDEFFPCRHTVRLFSDTMLIEIPVAPYPKGQRLFFEVPIYTGAMQLAFHKE